MSKVRLIDANAFKQQVTAETIRQGLNTGKAALMLALIDAQPTIDPVRHARWEYFKDTGMWGCSDCKARITRNSWEGEDSFCRDCGAHGCGGGKGWINR